MVVVVVSVVAVSATEVLATVLAVPVMVLPLSDSPVGKALAEYVMLSPAALAALRVVVDAVSTGTEIVSPSVGDAQVTESASTVRLNALSVSWFSASVALIVNE